jgi:uncharacterized protein YjbJ (UPF0337 family)
MARCLKHGISLESQAQWAHDIKFSVVLKSLVFKSTNPKAKGSTQETRGDILVGERNPKAKGSTQETRGDILVGERDKMPARPTEMKTRARTEGLLTRPKTRNR